MTQDRREGIGRWIGNGLDFRTFVMLVILIVGWLGNYFTLAARVTMLETRLDDMKAKYQLEVVPKTVLEVQAELLNNKLDTMNANLKVVQSQLDSYGPNSYIFRPYKGAKAGTVRKY